MGGVLLAAALGFGLWFFLRRTALARRLRKVLHQLGSEHLQQVILPDGLGGEIQIDYLVRMPDRLLVIDLKDMRGVLFGGEQIEAWTQIVERRSYRFPNPLHDNRLRCQAVRELVDGVAVVGRVVFTSQGSFPRGVPEGVSQVETLVGDLGGHLPAAIGAGLDEAWAAVRRVARPATD